MLSDEVVKDINRIAHKFAIKLRRADNIDFDPEGQRMKTVIADACFEAYRLAVPQDDGKTVSVTEAPGEGHAKPVSVRRGNDDGKSHASHQGH